MVNHYGRGTHVERLAVHHLTADGYVVIRSAGSKGKIDLAAFKPGELLFVQSKITGTISVADWDRVVELAGWVGATALLVERDRVAGCQEFHSPGQQRPERCGLVFTELRGRKVPRVPMRAQPCRPWVSDNIVAAVALGERRTAEGLALGGDAA